MSRERPILMSAPMVNAILAGAKTQTRRVADFPADTTAVRWVEGHETMPAGAYTGWAVQCSAPLLLPRKCPYGQPGDRLYVRETWAKRDGETLYRADIPAGALREERTVRRYARTVADDTFGPAWRPSIHMRREDSRLTLEVTGVRVERVQDISEADAGAEGTPATIDRWWSGWDPHGQGFVDAGHGDATPPPWMETPRPMEFTRSGRHHFSVLWDSINAKRGFGWEANPFVWVVEFRRVEAVQQAEMRHGA